MTPRVSGAAAPRWRPVPARLVWPKQAPGWWDLDGARLPTPIAGLFGILGDPARRALYGPVGRAGWTDGCFVCQCERAVLAWVPHYPALQVLVLSEAEATQIRALPALAQSGP